MYHFLAREAKQKMASPYFKFYYVHCSDVKGRLHDLVDILGCWALFFRVVDPAVKTVGEEAHVAFEVLICCCIYMIVAQYRKVQLF